MVVDYRVIVWAGAQRLNLWKWLMLFIGGSKSLSFPPKGVSGVWQKKVQRFRASPTPTSFSHRLLAGVVLQNDLRLWTLWPDPGRQPVHAVTCSGPRQGPGPMAWAWGMATRPLTLPAQRPLPQWSLDGTQRCCPPQWRPRRHTPPGGTRTCWTSWMRASVATELCHFADRSWATRKTRPTATDRGSGPSFAYQWLGSYLLDRCEMSNGLNVVVYLSLSSTRFPLLTKLPLF